MALRCLRLLKVNNVRICKNLLTTSVVLFKDNKFQIKCYKTEDNVTYFEDPDKFGTLSGKLQIKESELLDEGDIKEQEFFKKIPLNSQKLTIRQYADLIKQYLQHKRLKEAIDILEVRMLKEDRVKPDNYIYNILIGACADVGYTKKAFKLFNDMKRRALKPTGDTYTCLFQACVNSPWLVDGLQHAQNLRNLMLEKGIDPNLTNYNVMIKAFGRCGDLLTAFKIVDEMISKKIKIRVHTFNHLLHACITDKQCGLRHALVVWRKMLNMRERPNIYSFNLMLKCVKECNLGSQEDIVELIGIIHQQIVIENNKSVLIQGEIKPKDGKLQNTMLLSLSTDRNVKETLIDNVRKECDSHRNNHIVSSDTDQITDMSIVKKDLVQKINNSELAIVESNKVSIEFIDSLQKPVQIEPIRTVPNLLSRTINMGQVLSLQEVHTVQDKFAVLGGQDDFLKEMEYYSVKPDVKTFTQMLYVLDDNKEAESKLLKTLKALKINADINFYNMLIKKRCMRSDYDGAIDVKKIIEEEARYREKNYPLRYKKKLQLKANIMTYGVLTLACRTKESAEKLLSEMKELQLKVNIEILGTLLRHGTSGKHFGYIVYIMNTVKQENLKINKVFLKHLEAFNAKCANAIQEDENGHYKCTENFLKDYDKFLNFYKNWLKDIEETLETEQPWTQFRESYPETIQRQNIEIVKPNKFYKRNRRFIKYKPKL